MAEAAVEKLKEDVSNIKKDVAVVQLKQVHQSKRMVSYEKFGKAHMEKEDERWEKIESHMIKFNRILYIGMGCFMTLGVLWAFFKDVVRLLGN